MIKIDKILEEKKIAKMLLQIHDELIFECLKKDESKVKKIVKEAMTSVSSSDHHMFSIPLEVSIILETIGERPTKRLNFDNIIKRIKNMTQTIALVDDDRNILTSISMALEREGFNVQTYIDGESALIGLTRNPPDLAILDIKMPRMDGEELLKKLKKNVNTNNLPYI